MATAEQPTAAVGLAAFAPPQHMPRKAAIPLGARVAYTGGFAGTYCTLYAVRTQLWGLEHYLCPWWAVLPWYGAAATVVAAAGVDVAVALYEVQRAPEVWGG